MSSSSFASLNAGMLVRKGSAAPSLEAPIAPLRLRPVIVSDPIAKGPHPGMPDGRDRIAPQKPATAPAIPTPTLQVAPIKSDAAAACTTAPTESARPATRAGARLTHDQMRALRLAALLLDRPQQELLASGLDLKIQALACGPLAECSCFQAFSKKLAGR